MNFNKVGKCLCFRRKATSQNLIKKMFLVRSREVDKINNHCKSDNDLEVMENVSWGA